MTLRDYWELLRRSWLLIIATTLVGALAALGLSMLATPIYQAQSQLFVSVRSAEEISGAYTGGLYVQQRMKSYVTLVDTPGVLEPVIEGLELETTPAELAERVSAQNPTGTVLVNVLVQDVAAEQAAAIADATAKSLAAQIVRLETTESKTKPVQAQLIRPADVPEEASSPRILINVVLGGLLGLLAGIGIAVVRATLDTTVKSREDLREATHAPLLGLVAFDPGASKNPLVTLQGTPRAEAYRNIRTNLKYLDVDRPPRCVVVTSSIPQEGKSTTAANLALALAESGSKVLLVEADLRRPQLSDYLGVTATVGLTDVLIHRSRLEPSIVRWQRGLLDFLPSGALPPNPSELLGSQQMADLVTSLSARYDMLILDAPPLLAVTDAAILTTAADGAILVVRHGRTHRDQVQHAAAALAQVNARLIGTVLNFVPVTRRLGGYGHGYGYGYGYGHRYGSPRPASGKGKNGGPAGRPAQSAEEVRAPEPRA